MPIYEFVCQRKRPKVCGHITEKMMSLSEDRTKPIKCEKCNGKAVRVEISKSDFSLKGSGWYVSDYKGK